MFSMVQKMLQKSKVTSQLMLNSQPQPPRRPEPQPQPIPSTIKKKQTQTNIPPSTNTRTQPIKQKSKNQFDIQTIIFNTRRYDNKKDKQIKLRLHDDGLIELEFYDEAGKVRLETYVNDVNMEKNREQNSYIHLNSKKIKIYKPENRVNYSIEKEKAIEIYPRELKETKSAFYGFVNKPHTGGNSTMTMGDHPDPDLGENQDIDNPRFLPPTSSRLGQTERLRKNIRDMKEEDKVSILMDIFKIKKEYEDTNTLNRKLKCPVHTCEKVYREVNQLKTHLKTKHPELSRHGIELTEYDGSFDYSNKAMDFVLFLGKQYPAEMKKIIKKMKTKKQAE